MQAGILDNLDWETPSDPFYRAAQAGELSGQPAYAFRTAWSRPVNERPLSFGVAGYFGRQDWTWSRDVDAWAVMADWQIPILPRLGLTGRILSRPRYWWARRSHRSEHRVRRRSHSRLSPDPRTESAGGWSQLKFQLTPKLELNGVFAEDDAFAGDIRGFSTNADNIGGPILGRNRGALGNVVFRPRSDLVLSAEFRRLHTYPIYSAPSTLNQVNLSVGILF